MGSNPIVGIFKWLFEEILELYENAYLGDHFSHFICLMLRNGEMSIFGRLFGLGLGMTLLIIFFCTYIACLALLVLLLLLLLVPTRLPFLGIPFIFRNLNDKEANDLALLLFTMFFEA